MDDKNVDDESDSELFNGGLYEASTKKNWKKKARVRMDRLYCDQWC